MTQAEATLAYESDVINITAAEALSPGEIQQLSDGRACYYTGAEAAASGDVVGMRVGGIVRVKAASATTFSAGADVVWDASASAAVGRSAAVDGSADFYIGKAIAAKISGQLFVLVDLNAPSSRVQASQVFVFEFDVADGDTAAHQIIPAEANPHGLVIEHIFGVVTEVMAGSSEDQGIVVVSDESDNALATLTAADAAADAAGDYLLGFQLASTASGTAAKIVAAGEYVDAAVTQQTAGGAPAGKIKVFIVAHPLV